MQKVFSASFYFLSTSEITLREFPLVIATVAKISRKRGLWLVVRVKKSLQSILHKCSAGKRNLFSFLNFFHLRPDRMNDKRNK